jgi:Peptidase inhibitor family I36
MPQLTARSPRRAILAILAALVGATAVLAVSASMASAAYGRCDPGEFCLYSDTAQVEGIYHYAGSDGNLNNDRFERGDRNQIVGNNTYSAFNFGLPDARSSVAIYTETGYRGWDACIPRAENGQLPRNWWRTIASYRWVTWRECVAAGIIRLD